MTFPESSQTPSSKNLFEQTMHPEAGNYTAESFVSHSGSPTSTAAVSADAASSAQLLPEATSADRGQDSSGQSLPLSIVHIGPCFTRGGAEQQLIDLARFLDPSRAVLTKCLVTESQMIDPQVAADVACPVLNATAEDIRQALTEHDIILFWGLELDRFCEDRLEGQGVCIYLAHGDSHWTRDLMLGSTACLDYTVAVSQRVAETTCYDFPTDVILNGVDTARLATTRSRNEVRKRYGFGPDDFVVGYLGRFSPEKRPELLIQALAELPSHFKLLLVGWGPLKPQLLEQANDTIPNRYAFATGSSYLGDFYNAMDAFCLVSVQEGFALVFLEAMFSGLPVIATPVGAVPEVIENNASGVIVNGDVHAIVDALKRVGSNPRWSRAMGEEARQYALCNGHARTMAVKYEDLFERMTRK
ncbi:MAG: glycosyltransferase family 4 protein [Rhodopirellula sp.]|nr:glycosyltransferase family 4 protein [Rhodopirellula sp.]